jgi:cardiolipin synthase C
VRTAQPARAGALKVSGLLLLAGALSSCATLPSQLPRGAAGCAADPRPGGAFAEAEARIAALHGPESSGFKLLEANEQGLRWRLALIDSALYTLDAQYYTWWGDEAGVLLMKRIVQAADRGVKVRVVLDDLSTLLEDEKTPKVRDEIAAFVDAHPNIEIRLFNPWHSRSLGGRGVETVTRMERMNHRMHNKQLIADNRAVILGGRNVGNEYLGLSPHSNFRDLDLLAFGPAARKASTVFDSFWNSEWVVPASALGVDATLSDLRQEQAPVQRKLTEAEVLARFSLEPRDWSDEIGRTVSEMRPGVSRVHADSPDHEALSHHMPAAIRRLIGSARREVLITNAYVIPDATTVQGLKELTARGVKIKLLTNSLASHDVPAVNSHYKKWRKPLLEAGVELYEIRPDAAIKRTLADTSPNVAKHMGLHVKAMVIDRERVFIGSMNLDPRSAAINSEMGAIVESPGLAEQLAAAMERDMGEENSWRVTVDGGGSLRWTSQGVVLTSQPAQGTWQRVEDAFFMLFPRDLY